MKHLETVLSDPIYQKVIWFTFYQALLSTALTIILALPGSYLLSRYSFPGKRVILAASLVPFVIPSLVLAVGLIAIFGWSGSMNGLTGMIEGLVNVEITRIDLVGTRTIILIGHIFFNFPIALRILHARYMNMDQDLSKASRSLGAGKIRTFFSVTLPQMKYSLLAASSLIFTFCFLSFGIVVMLGGLNHTIEVELKSLFTGLTVEKFHHAGALLIIETVIVLFTTLVYVWSSSRETSRAEIAFRNQGNEGNRMGPWQRIGVLLYILIIFVMVIYPLLIIFIRSFFGNGTILDAPSLEFYRAILSMQKQPETSVSPVDSIRNSLMFGLLTMIFSLPLSYLTARAMKLRGGVSKRTLDMLLLFPLGASSIALGYGLVKTYSVGPIEITGTWYIIVLVHLVIAYPIGARSIYSSMMSIPSDIKRASRSLGASPLETFIRIELPLLMPGILVAAVFAFAVSMGELGATLMVSGPEFETMPIYLYDTIEGAGRNLGPMYAFSVIYMAITFVSFLTIELIQRSFTKWGLNR